MTASRARLRRLQRLLLWSSAFAVFPWLADPLRAQGVPTGRLEGTITDSVHSRPLSGAPVLAIRVDPAQPPVSSGATTDARGRFRLDTLPVGRYMVEFSSPFLDSLEMIFPPREVVIAGGQTSRLEFAIPSGRTLRAAACPGVQLPEETGAMVGRVLDADTERPLPGASVVTSWTELTVDRATLRSSYESRTGSVTTDSLGQYRLCGVPTDSWFMVQVQHGGTTGSAIRSLVPDSAGVIVRQLSLSPRSSRPATAGSATSPDTTRPMLTGTAAVSGLVLGLGGVPLAQAQVRVIGAAPTARTDAQGRFTLGDLPAGSQVLEVRHVGYLLAELPVELRGERTVLQDVRLQRIVNLDSVRVLAQRSRYRQFEEHRKRSGFGRFMDTDAIARSNPYEMSDLVRMIPGFRVSGSGLDAKVVSSRGVVSVTGSCEVNIVIDGMQHQEINLIHPSSVGSLEAYPAGGPPGPLEYDGRCGLIVLWSKR